MRPSEIKYRGNFYFIDKDEMEDPSLDKVFLYLDENLSREFRDIAGIHKLVSKEEISFNINESGAGFAVWGGMNRGGYGNPMSGGKFYGRGSGFGQSSSNNGGPNLMYTYDIKPLNKTLEQPPTPQSNTRYFHPGSEIFGIQLGTKKKVRGQILSIEKNEDEDIIFYLIMDDNGIKIKIDPSSVEIIQRESPSIVNRDIVGESFYPSFKKFLQSED